MKALSCALWPPVVIAQMFEWTWDSIGAECINFLGPAGYGFVQGKPRPHLPVVIANFVDLSLSSVAP